MADLRHYLCYNERTGPQSVVTTILRELTPAEDVAAGVAIATAYEAIRGVAGFANVARNDLNLLMAQLHEMATNETLRTQAEIWPTHLQYRVVAVSAALRMLEEYAVAAVQRRHGKEAREVELARSIFQGVYDESFAYRVIYYLRNALVHGSRGLVSAFAKSTLVPDVNGAEEVETLVELRLVRSAVATSKMKAVVRDQVLALPHDPDVVALCGQALDAINSARHLLDPLVNPDLSAALQLIRGYMDEVAPFEDIPHFHTWELGHPESSHTMHAMTLGVAEYVRASTPSMTE